MTVNRIYVDMDGVLADFEAKYQEVFGQPSKVDGKHPKDFFKKWKVWNENEFFKYLNLMPGANDLLDYLETTIIDDFKIQVQVLSASGGHGFHDKISNNKIEWLRKHNLWYKPNIVPSKKIKKDYADHDCVLIDDDIKNVNEFVEAGGWAIHHKDAETTIRILNEIIFERGP